MLQLTHASAVNGVAIFSPDGRKLGISIGNTWARLQLLFAPVDGSHLEPVLPDTSFCVMDWSRDGRYLIGDGSCAESLYCIQYIDLHANMKPIPVVKKPFVTERPVLSPNGKWVAYNSRETGRDEVYISAFPGPGRTLRISNSGGFMPEWRPDGTTLYYLRDPHTIMSARVTDASAFAFARPKVLFELGQEIVLFRVARGGDRFLLQTAAPSYSPLRLVVNWEKLMK
jgi:Tol biopolymer transport system component